MIRIIKHFKQFRTMTAKLQILNRNKIRYLSQEEAILLDKRLMGDDGGYRVSQLMELAGQSCAVAIENEYSNHRDSATEFIIVSGPGNNGGDGLVIARHLLHYGFKNVRVVYPRETTNDLYLDLLKQCKSHGIDVSSELVRLTKDCVVVDALFGFSFRPPLKKPFDEIINKINEAQSSGAKVVSIDIPTGWHVENGPLSDGAGADKPLTPDMLVSLTAPKKCAEHFKGSHYIGGRFVPPGFTDYPLPVYTPGPALVMKVASL